MAGRIPEEFINEVRNSVNIVDVISQYVSLTKKGKDYTGLCPFHQEKTPSFTVNESKQFFKCFGCGKGGNVFKFMMYQENLTFPESVRAVAEMANIPMPAGVGDQVAPLSPLKRMYQDATEFYQHILLTTQAGEKALAYARQRELDDELIEHFKIGYAPDNESILYTFLKQKDYDEDLLRRSGLFVESREGKLYDRFRDRLMFPLGDETGRTVGFSGRRISDNPEIAKYMNSPETEIFNKSQLLFHLAEARKAARTENHLILYEGYMDVIAAYKAGIKSGVASMGTSLTTQQIYILRRITPNVIINYDGDEPGIHAAERASRLFEQAGNFNLGIVVLPDGLDPDEYVKKYGPEKYQGEVQAALTPTDFMMKRLAKKYNLHNDREKLSYINEAIALIAQLQNPVAADLYLNNLAKQTSTTVDSLKVSLLRERRKQRRAQKHQESLVTPPPPEIEVGVESNPDSEPALEKPNLQRLLYLFIHSEESRNYLLSKGFLFPDPNYARLAELWLKFMDSSSEQTIQGFIDFIPEKLQGIIVSMEMAEMPADYSKREIDDQLRALENNKIDERLQDLMHSLDEAQRLKDDDQIMQIIQQVITLKRQKK